MASFIIENCFLVSFECFALRSSLQSYSVFSGRGKMDFGNLETVEPASDHQV